GEGAPATAGAGRPPRALGGPAAGFPPGARPGPGRHQSRPRPRGARGACATPSPPRPPRAAPTRGPGPRKAAAGTAAARAQPADPRQGVLAIFDAYADHAALAYERGFRGCGLLNAAAELPAGDPGRGVVRAHKEEVERLLVGHLDDLLPGRPDAARALAEH